MKKKGVKLHYSSDYWFSQFKLVACNEMDFNKIVVSSKLQVSDHIDYAYQLACFGISDAC